MPTHAVSAHRARIATDVIAPTTSVGTRLRMDWLGLHYEEHAYSPR
jgi:hypothetical protein